MLLVMLVEVLDQVKFGKSIRVTRLSERSESNGDCRKCIVVVGQGGRSDQVIPRTAARWFWEAATAGLTVSAVRTVSRQM